MDDSTKDYIINLRVSKRTYDKIKGKAAKNRDTISNLVRSIINDSVEIVHNISEDLRSKDQEKYADLVSYYKGALAQDKECDNCDILIAKHSTVTIGATESDKRYYFCLNCR